MTGVRFRVLGPLEVERNGNTVEIRGDRQRALLARLLLDAGRFVTAERLIEELWGEDAPQAARKRLQMSVARLRKALGDDGAQPVIVSVAGGYMAQLEPGQLDRDEYERLVATGRRALAAGDVHGAAAALADAGRLWRGPPLEDIALGPMVEGEIGRLQELRLAAIEDGIEARLALGQERDAIPVVELLIVQHPLRERLYGQLMLALYRTGRQAHALEVYQRIRRRLGDDLGLQPGAALQQLERDILNHEPALLPRAAPPAVRAAARRNVLPAARTRSSFVGRAEELALLAGAFELGACRLQLVEGEAGIGKSRLALQFAEQRRKAGTVVLYGRCDAETLVPYQPFVEALRMWLDPEAIARLSRDIAAELRELSRVLPELGPPPPKSDEDAERHRLFDAVSVLLAEIARAQPLLLVLDDLHWADQPTLLMLRRLVRSRPAATMLVLGTYRPTEVGPGFREMVADLRRDHVIERLPLAGLARDDSARLIAELSASAVGERVERALFEQSRGNPFFLEEMVRDRGTGDSAPAAVPDAVKDVIGRRLARVSDDLRKALALASVAGNEFELELLEALSRLPEETLYDAIDEGIEAHLIVELPGAFGRFAFEHSLTRQTLLESLTRTRRARLHLRVGEWLEHRAGDGHGQRLAELAHHFGLAPPDPGLAKAAEYAARAGRHALDVLAFEDAVRHYEVALEATERLGSDEQALEEVLLCLASARAKAGDTAAARETYRRLVEVARRRGSARGLAAAALGLGFSGHVLRATVDDEIVALLREALETLGDDDPRLRSRLLARLAIELSFSAQHAERAAISQQAVRVARDTGEPAALGSALLARHWSLWDPSTVAQRLEVASELLALGDATRESKLRLEAHRWLMIDQLELGDIGAVDRELDAYERLANERGRASELWTAHLYRAMRHLLSGRFEEAEARSRRALELGTRAGDRNAGYGHFLQTAALARDRGGLEPLVDIIRPRVHRAPGASDWRCLLVCVLTDLGRLDEAQAEMDAFEPAAIPRTGLWLGAIAYLADAAAALGDRRRSAEVYDLLRPFADRTVAIVWASTCAGSVSRVLGALAATLGRPADAARHFEHALRRNRELEAVPWSARTQVQYGGLLLEGTDEQRARGRELVREGTATAEQLGMDDLAQRGRELSV